MEILPGCFKQVVKLVFSVEAWIYDPAMVILSHSGQGREKDTKGGEEGSLQDGRANKISQISKGLITSIWCFRVRGDKSVREDSTIHNRAGELQGGSNLPEEFNFLFRRQRASSKKRGNLLAFLDKNIRNHGGG